MKHPVDIQFQLIETWYDYLHGDITSNTSTEVRNSCTSGIREGSKLNWLNFTSERGDSLFIIEANKMRSFCSRYGSSMIIRCIFCFMFFIVSSPQPLRSWIVWMSPMVPFFVIPSSWANNIFLHSLIEVFLSVKRIFILLTVQNRDRIWEARKVFSMCSSFEISDISRLYRVYSSLYV